MIDLEDTEWDALYEEVLVLAIRISAPRRRGESGDPEQPKLDRATQKDRANEATQRAFERYQRVRPAVRSKEELRHYLQGAMRSELNHTYREATTQKDHEEAAMVEVATVSGRSVPSPEEAILQVGEVQRERTRLARRTKRLLAELEGDALARATVECVANGIDSPVEQARILKCSVEDIHNARKRRSRAVERVLAAERDDEDETDNDGDEE